MQIGRETRASLPSWSILLQRPDGRNRVGNIVPQSCFIACTTGVLRWRRESLSQKEFFTRFQPYPRTACIIQAMKPDQVQNNTTTTTEDVQPSVKTPQITSSPIMQVTEQEDHTLAPVCRPSRTTTADATTPSLLPLCLRSPSHQVVEFLSIGGHSQET